MRVYEHWIKSPAARRVILHWADSRPAWLWSHDGLELLWRNRAACLFGAKTKKNGLRLMPPPVPIKGQVARLLRLGANGRSSLSRMQFLVGDRPASATTIVTPLENSNGQPIALIVGVDPIAPEVLAQPVEGATSSLALFSDNAAYILWDPEGQVVETVPETVENVRDRGVDTIAVNGQDVAGTRFRASPQGHQLLLSNQAMAHVENALTPDTSPADEHSAGQQPSTTSASGRPTTSFDAADKADKIAASMADIDPAATTDHGSDPQDMDERRLSSLFDRLAGSDELYRGLAKRELPVPIIEDDPDTEGTDAVDEATLPPEESAVGAETAGPLPGTSNGADRPADSSDMIAAVIAFEDDLDGDHSSSAGYRVVGRGFAPAVLPAASDGEAGTEESVERTSRYNFSELSRILTDRMATDPSASGLREAKVETPHARKTQPDGSDESRAGSRGLINIAGETFILNRLPLGILVFRDQQILFANRALTDLLGYSSIDDLRVAGLTSIFPSDDPATAGPITHLVRRDAASIAVSARLQSITWQGRPALLLSALNVERQIPHEAMVRDFTADLATLRHEGFVTLDRAGIFATLDERAKRLLGQDSQPGTPLSSLLDDKNMLLLRTFLERPARFAEKDRPAIRLSTRRGADITIMAEGMAGIVNGYFALVTTGGPNATQEGMAPTAEDPVMLARISRGIRRPLNTIVGFADLIRSAAFGTIENHRHLEYARDIKAAGQEIAVLVDELDDYARLKAGTFVVRPADLDLVSLLESCVVRVRGQASAARVLVRTSIPETLPHIRADRASLGQAILNLLASAIDQTPPSGAVILSAQHDDIGGIVINVRDSGEPDVDPGERFVVFRDGLGKDGEALAPVRSGVGLALTRSLIAVNACALEAAPAGAVGMIFSVTIPAELIGPAAA